MAKPGKHVFICTQSRPAGHPRGSCSQKGCNEVLQTFWEELKNRNAYDHIAVTFSGCLGPCDQGPNVLVYPDGILYGHVTKDDVVEIFNSHLIDNVPVERLRVSSEIW